MKHYILLSIATFCLTYELAFAQVPTSINYQGKLTDSSGNPLTGSHTLKFNIYNVVTGGTAIWGPQTYPGFVLTADGQFNLILGPTDTNATPRQITDAFAGQPRFLGITVDANSEIIPRQGILSVPYAMQSLIRDGSVTNAMLGANSVTTAKISDGAVTTTKIPVGAISTSQIADGAVTSSKLANGASLEVGTILEIRGSLAETVIDPRTLDTNNDGIPDLPLGQGKTFKGGAPSQPNWMLCLQNAPKNLQFPGTGVDSALAGTLIPDKPFGQGQLANPTYTWTQLTPASGQSAFPTQPSSGYLMAYDSFLDAYWLFSNTISSNSVWLVWRDTSVQTQYRKREISLPVSFSQPANQGRAVVMTNSLSQHRLIATTPYGAMANSYAPQILIINGTLPDPNNPQISLSQSASDTFADWSPPNRRDVQFFYDPTLKRFHFMGGGNTALSLTYSDHVIYQIDANDQFSFVQSVSPAPGTLSNRAGGFCAFDEAHNRGFVFGGFSGPTSPLGDLLIYNPANQTWGTLTQSATKPDPRFQGLGFMHPLSHEFMVFGGFTASQRVNDLYGYDYDSQTWTLRSPVGTKPSARHNLSYCLDTTRNRLVMFGGDSDSGGLNDLWELSFGGKSANEASIVKVN